MKDLDRLKKSKDRKKAVLELSDPVRQALQTLIRQKIKTKNDREDLANFLGIKVTSLSNMLYKGEGGLNLWIATLIYCYELDTKDFLFLVENYPHLQKQFDKLSKEEKEWIALGKKLRKHDKIFVTRLIDMALELQESLKK